jgi:transcription initiation factor IIF auxiliary subunit
MGVVEANEVDEAGGGEFGVDAGVFFAERADAQNGDTNF